MVDRKVRILVTGSAGLIGSHLVDYLMDQGYEVYGCDNLSVGSIDNISRPAMVNFYKVDLLDKVKTIAMVKEIEPQVVFHCAAWAHEGLAQFTPALITENNINAFLNLVVPAINSGLERFVFFSSVAVYGDQEPPFTEEMPTKPDDIYAINKVAIEQMLRVLADVHGFEYTVFRAFNVFGEHQMMSDPYRGVVAIFMNQLLHDQPFVIYGDGEQKRGFTYVKDVVPYIADSIFEDKAKNETINIGGSNVYTVNQLATTILKIAGGVHKPEHLAERSHDVKVAYCDTSKAQRLLGLKEGTPLEQALTNMWTWAKEQGPQLPKYLDHLEIPSDKVPKNWLKHE